MKSLAEMTITDPGITRNPYEFYERLRNEDPVHFDEKLGAWLVTRHKDIIEAARNTTVFSDEMRVAESVRSPYQDEANEYIKEKGFYLLDPSDSFKVDGELHARRRKLVSHAFTAHAVAAMADRVAELCKDQFETFKGKSEVDLFKEYAVPVPIKVICDALGLPLDRIEDVRRAADSLVARAGKGASREEAFQHADNVMQLQQFARDAINQRREAPTSDLISQLVNSGADNPEDDQLTEQELISIVSVSIAGGVDTTRNTIAYALYTLATRPDLLKRLQESDDQDKLLSAFCEETLRFYAPVPALPRVVTEDTELGGKKIPKDALVFLCWASGNRDPERFENPDEFSIDRKASSQHLSFGTGVHVCLGAMLARNEVKAALKQFINSVESFELAVSPEDLDYSDSLVILRGVNSLPVRLKAKAG
ncbi:cytochrome P450 [Pseudomaricurvus sp. HS19]|uniref:cytochrome P450 n=1 Tax=Pseudomaricurvus sp. HS19 TaxID=2692626 RepID=UPI001367C34A|nr:cytochrome P450 [Pseudomaricurvus sp. HS19]MYM63916.1 cytochrome P450 [Pseudomaricurvus sp. HS19]